MLLHRAGALVPSARTVWKWADGGKTNILAAHGEIFLSGDFKQVIRFGYIPLMLMHGGERMRLFCPICNCGAYFLAERKSKFACKKCFRLDWRCRHRRRYNPFVEEADGRSHNRSRR